MILEPHWRDILDQLAERNGWPTTHSSAMATGVAQLSAWYNRTTSSPTDRFTPAMEAARLLFFFPRDVPKSTAALRDLKLPAGTSHIRILDLGAGLGATSFGAWRYLRQQGVRSAEITAVDVDGTALKLLPEIFRHEPSITINTVPHDAEGFLDKNCYDLILIGQTLCELSPWLPNETRVERHAVWISRLLRQLTPQGALLIVEPALRETSRYLHQVRDQLITLGWPPLSPCRHANRCPMLEKEGDWCHEHRDIDLPDWLIPIARAAGLRWEGLTFSHLLLSAERTSETTGFRVVSEPLRTKGRLDYFICGLFPDGSNRQKVGRLDRHRSPDNAAWDELQRGDLMDFTGNPRIDSETKIQLR